MRRVLKWLGYAGGVIVIIAIGLYLRGGAITDRMMNKVYTVPAVTVSASARARATVARGKHLYESRGGCAECHADDLGGHLLYNNIVIGRFGGINLTRRVKTRTDEQLYRSIRQGVNDEGKANWMPSAGFHKAFTEVDLASLVKYIRSAPPVDRPDTPLTWGAVIRIMLGAGQTIPVDPEKIDYAAPFPAPVPEVVGARFGKSLVQGLCVDCHKDDLTGGPMPGSPPGFAPAANLTQDALGTWTEAGFIKTLRTGVDPAGHQLREPMGGLVKYTARCTDVELKSIWAYLKTVKGKANF